ncbi:DUF6458 family protein [Plantactinospora siamensis]|uniref:DUF6458 family protein n=1 Tax=Plantactinospora siamensis TaxID=555372 RepID=A0ABV6NRZ3_9ACTN
MGIGVSIFLLALGAILAFALNIDIAGIDVHVIGWILMAAGVIGLIMTALIWGRRRQVVAPAETVEYRSTEPVEYRREAPPL